MGQIVFSNMNQLEMIQIPLVFLWLCKEYGSLPHRDFDTEFWLSAIRPVALSLSGRLIKDVLEFNGSLYSEEKYELWMKWNFEDIWKFQSEIHINYFQNKILNHNKVGKEFQTLGHLPRFYHRIWILKHCLLWDDVVFQNPRSRVK